VLRQAIKSRPDIRVIILSAYGTIDLAVEAMNLGAVDFIPKPFAPEEIRERVVRVLDREKVGQIKKDRLRIFN
jgi:DNA-binding NtrC family response regulator